MAQRRTTDVTLLLTHCSYYALQLLQSCAKPSKLWDVITHPRITFGGFFKYTASHIKQRMGFPIHV